MTMIKVVVMVMILVSEITIAPAPWGSEESE